jgi:hypothetical protein
MCAAGGAQRDPLVRHLEPARLDAALDVPRRERAQRPQAERQVEADDQPSPVGIASSEVEEGAVRSGHDLGRVVELRRRRVDRFTPGRNRLGQHGLDDRFLGLEVVVERPEPHIGLVGDLVDPCVVDPLAGKQPARGVDELGAGPPATARVAVGGTRGCRLLWCCSHV